VRRAFAGARPDRLSRSREIEVANPPRAQRDFTRKVGARYDHETHSLMPHRPQLLPRLHLLGLPRFRRTSAL
jgi:hypothetical protein